MVKRTEIVKRVVNKQFEMIGEEFRIKDLTEHPIIELKVKKKVKTVYWYEYYLFKDENQYLEWRKWAEEELKREGYGTKEIVEIDLLYGMNYKLDKTKGQLDLF
jgi:hypothetical protein